MRFRLYAVLAGILLLAAAFAAVPAALAEGSGTVVYSESGGAFWFLPMVRCSDSDPLWLIPIKLDKPITSLTVDFIAAVLGYGGDKYHYNSSVTLVVVDLNSFEPTKPTFDWRNYVVYEANQTVDWYDLDWVDYRDLATANSHLTLTFSPALDPGFYGIGLYTQPSGAFPGELALVSAYGEPAIIWMFWNDAKSAWWVNFRYYHPIGSIDVTEGEGSGGAPPAESVKILMPKENDTVSGTTLVIAQADKPPVLWVDDEPVGTMRPVLLPNNEYYFRYWLDTRKWDDGTHNLTVKTSSGSDTVTVVFDNVPDSGTIKVTIDAPRDGSTVPPVFKYIVTVAWENLSTPGVEISVNNVSIPSPVMPSPPGTWRPPEQGGIMVLRGMVDTQSLNLTPGDTVEFKVTATSGTVTASAVAHYTIAGDHPGPTATVVRSYDGYKILTDPDVVAVIAHRGAKSVMAEQRGAGMFYVPASALNAQAIALDVNTEETEFEAISADGSSSVATYSPFTFVGGSWWEEHHPEWWPSWLPWWVPVLLVVILFLLGGRKRRRRRW